MVFSHAYEIVAILHFVKCRCFANSSNLGVVLRKKRRSGWNWYFYFAWHLE